MLSLIRREREREKLLSENSTDKLIFVNIKNSYEAMINDDRNNPLFRSSLMIAHVRIGQSRWKSSM